MFAKYFKNFRLTLSVIVLVASASSFKFQCKMIFKNGCFNFDADTSKQHQDKARVTGANIENKKIEEVNHRCKNLCSMNRFTNISDNVVDLHEH
jgi:hypothetical protein